MHLHTYMLYTCFNCLSCCESNPGEQHPQTINPRQLILLLEYRQSPCAVRYFIAAQDAAKQFGEVGNAYARQRTIDLDIIDAPDIETAARTTIRTKTVAPSAITIRGINNKAVHDFLQKAQVFIIQNTRWILVSSFSV